MPYFQNSPFRKQLSLVMIAVLVLIIGCKYTISIDLSLKSILSIAAQGPKAKNEDTTVQIRFQISSLKKCEQERENIEAILSKYYKEVKDSKCEKEGSKVYLKTNAFLTIRALPTSLENQEQSMVGLVVDARENKTDVLLTMDKEMFKSLGEDMKKKYKQNTRMEDLTLTIHLKNDTEAAYDLKIFHSYVNDKAYPAFGMFQMKAEESYAIKVSDVMKDYVNINGIRRLLEIKKAKEPSSTEKEGIQKELPDSSGEKSYSDDEDIIIY